jgi:predicted metal-dependent RNase
MRRHADILDAETHAKLARAADPLLNDRVHLVESVEASKRIDAMPGTSIIIAPSGMCDSGASSTI